MSRASRKSQSVSLFPFLAVLVCAMGSLLVLLIITTQQIRNDRVEKAKFELRQKRAQAVAAAPRPVEPPVVAPKPRRTPPPPPAPFDPNVTVREEVLRLQTDREHSRQERDEKLKAATAAQERLKLMQSKSAGLNNVIRETQTLEAEDGRLRKEIEQAHAEVDSQAAELRRKLREVRAQQASASSRYAFIPFDGQSGTTRRPIFIECRREGIRFLPEDVVVTPQDLEGFRAGSNPLLAGTQALLSYWASQKRLSSDPDSKSDPYILFLVRPDGSVAYYVARNMLSRLTTPTGYELIDEEMELAFPKADRDAALVLQKAISDALKQRPQSESTTVATPEEKTRGFHFERGAGGGFVLDESSNGGRNGFNSGSQDDGNSSSANGGGGSGGSYGNSPHVPDGNQPSPGGSSNRANANPFDEGESDRVFQSKRGSAAPTTLHDRKPGGSATASPHGNLSRLSTTSEVSSDDERLFLKSSDDSHAQPEGPQVEYIGKQKPAAQQGVSTIDDDELIGRKGAGTQRSESSRPADVRSTPTGVFDESYGEKSRNSRPQSNTVKRRWGISGAKGTIGLERAVEVEVDGNRIVVGGDVVIRVGQGESRDELASAFLGSLDSYIHTWGSPPPDFYWVPSVKFVVTREGNEHCARIEGVLRDMGIRSSVEAKKVASRPSGAKRN